MDQDLYAVLGVKRTATNDEIRRAYRKLAKDLHPDQNKGDPKSEEKFKRVSAAFAIVGNPDKRKRYDAGEIDAMGNERANPFYRDYAGGERDPGFGGFNSPVPAAHSRCAAWITVTTSRLVFSRR
jgi:curved DNA-binding protein CbpA